jgi:hypothetical protein
MRIQRKFTASTLGLIGFLAVGYGVLQDGNGETQHVADPPPIVSDIVDGITDQLPELPDDMHW